ncbi:glycosyltransferase [Inquilinus sp. CAU 1745]|uniref:glycosyltransferase family 4 protein n=1 Tax=Inquilinus sp. CAU 1745 TaxID=3140369 RepID=UPI00325AFE72
MKILHVITGLSDGGAEAVLHRLCTYDDVHRHAVVSLMDEGKYGPLLRAAGVDVYCLGMPRGGVTLRALLRLVMLLRQQRPQVVQTWMYHADLIGGLAARLAGIREVCWGIRHSNLVLGKSRRSTILVAKTCAWLSGVVPRTIVCCSHQAAEVHRALGYAGDKFRIIPNGYDLTRFAPDLSARLRLRMGWSSDSDVPVIGMVARFDPQKDHGNLIAALGRLSLNGQQFLCILAGYGVDAENAELCGRLEAAGVRDRVLLLGQQSDIPAIMSALDVHVLSSSSEAFPNVLAEAMACGIPCVTTDVGDASLIVGKTGWVVPPRDGQALAGALAVALGARLDPAAWEDRRQACQSHILEKFSIERMIEAYHAVWQEAAGQTGRLGQSI